MTIAYRLSSHTNHKKEDISMALYDNLPGIELEIKDGNLILPAEPSPTQTVLIIAPTSTSGVAGPYEASEYNPVAITGQSDFETKNMGMYDSNNPMARLWKQAYDAGCRDIRVVKLKGTTAPQRYGYLHDIFYVLEENITADIVLVGGIYADDTVGTGVTFGFLRNDFAGPVAVNTLNYTSVSDEALGTGDGTAVTFQLDNFPVLPDFTMTKFTGTVAAIFNTGSFTAIADDDAGKTVIFKGVTATVKTSATPVAASATSATAGEITIANTATAATTAAAFKDVFDAIKAAFPTSAAKDFAFAVATDALTITGNILDGDINNGQEITGSATFANKGNKVGQLTTLGVGTVATVLSTDYSIDHLTGTVTFATGKVPAAGSVLKATYKHYVLNFAAQLAGFCETVSEKNKQVLGVIALKPPVDNNLSTVKTYVDNQKTQYYSRYLQVVGGAPLWFSLGSAIYEDMWHGAYAGFISVLSSYSSPTFKAIPGALFGSYKLSPTQITSLINKHIVVPRERNARIIVAEAITTSADASDFVRLTTLRVVNDVIQVVREISEPYIGEPNTVARRNALDTSIREGLTNMVSRGALNDFRFHITSTIADQIDGTMRIMLDVVPVFETRRILMSVAVKPSL